MKTWQVSQDNEGFELTPMIDVVFLLIAFFMMVSTMVSDEMIPIEIPLAEEAVVPEDTRGRQFISITADGTLFLGARAVELEALTPAIREGAETIPNFKVYIRADAGVPHREVRDVMQAVADGGVFDIVFASNIR